MPLFQGKREPMIQYVLQLHNNSMYDYAKFLTNNSLIHQFRDIGKPMDPTSYMLKLDEVRDFQADEQNQTNHDHTINIPIDQFRL